MEATASLHQRHLASVKLLVPRRADILSSSVVQFADKHGDEVIESLKVVKHRGRRSVEYWETEAIDDCGRVFERFIRLDA